MFISFNLVLKGCTRTEVVILLLENMTTTSFWKDLPISHLFVIPLHLHASHHQHDHFQTEAVTFHPRQSLSIRVCTKKPVLAQIKSSTFCQSLCPLEND